MRKIAALFTFMILAVSAVVFSPATASACEDETLPIRTLYVESDLIVIGKIGKPGKWVKFGKMEDGYQTFVRTVPIIVEETLKGKLPKILALSENYTHYLGDAADYKQRLKTGKDLTPPTDNEGTLAENKGRRIFMIEKDENGTYVEFYGGSERDFMQKGADFTAHAKRLRELNVLYKAPKLDKVKVLEMLVAMTEDRVTRYDGVYELYTSAWRNIEADRQAAAKAKGEKTDEAVSGDEYSEEGHADMGGDLEFTKMLTPAQKQRIGRAFMTVKFDYTAKKTEDAEPVDYYMPLNHDDDLLMQTAAMIRDRNSVERMIVELPKMVVVDAYTTGTMIDRIAEYFGDERLEKIKITYANIQHGDSKANIEEKSYAFDNVKYEEDLKTMPDKTYGARRDELVSQIIAHCRALVAAK